MSELLPNGTMVETDPFMHCRDVSFDCPVEATIYGYRPNLGANVFFVIFFGVALLVSIWQGFKYKSWWFNGWIIAGCAGEVAGYAGRVAMHYNPWNNDAFMDQIATLIFSPSFYAAAIYLTLKHMVRAVGPEYSPIPASIYPWLFIICDFISLMLQAAGGGIAAGSDDDDVTDMGGKVMLAGIIFQVITLTFLYTLLVLVVVRMRRARATIKPEVMALLRSRDFRLFGGSIFIASLGIYIRCVYRIAELADGWASEVMRNEVDYIILEGVMCAIAVLCLCATHPGKYFKCMLTQEYPSRSYVGEDKVGSIDLTPTPRTIDNGH